MDADLVAALRALPGASAREVVVLHHLGDLSVEDCAVAMGVAVPSVKSHLQRGRVWFARAAGRCEETVEASHD